MQQYYHLVLLNARLIVFSSISKGSTFSFFWCFPFSPLTEARGIICYLAVREMGYKGFEVGKEMHLGPAGVSIAVRRGEVLMRNNPGLKEKIMNIIRWLGSRHKGGQPGLGEGIFTLAIQGDIFPFANTISQKSVDKGNPFLYEKTGARSAPASKV